MNNISNQCDTAHWSVHGNDLRQCVSVSDWCAVNTELGGPHWQTTHPIPMGRLRWCLRGSHCCRTAPWRPVLCFFVTVFYSRSQYTSAVLGVRSAAEREKGAGILESLVSALSLSAHSGTTRSSQKLYEQRRVAAERRDTHTHTQSLTTSWESGGSGPGWIQAIGTAQPRGNQEITELAQSPWKHRQPRQIMETGN